MTDKAEEDLIALVSHEQRGFRRILFAGLATLLVLVAMSAAMGVFYYRVSQQLTETSLDLQRDAFRARREMDQQSNRVADQGRRIRRLSFELRRAGDRPDAPADPASAIAAAGAYLQSGRLSSEDERIIEAASAGNAGSEPAQAVLHGVAALVSWERNGDAIALDARELPARLQRALESFQSAASDPQLGRLAFAGAAWVGYIRASSPLSNYAAADCDAVIAAVAASAQNGAPGPQPLWWQAQCERKLGRTGDALRDYARALELSYEVALDRTGTRGRGMAAELTLAMNAFHGVGTTLIAVHDTPDADPAKAAALAVARRACAIESPATAAPDLQLAEACLRVAMSVRERLGQTPNQVSGSAENMGFVYLRDNNFEAAFNHAQRVEHTGLFAWNELVRAPSAAHVHGAEAARAGRIARRNVSFFDVGQFNLCELQALLAPELYQEATALIADQHPDETVTCVR